MEIFGFTIAPTNIVGMEVLGFQLGYMFWLIFGVVWALVGDLISGIVFNNPNKGWFIRFLSFVGCLGGNLFLLSIAAQTQDSLTLVLIGMLQLIVYLFIALQERNARDGRATVYTTLF